MKKSFYAAVFVLLIILQAALVTVCILSGVRELRYDFAKALMWLLITLPVSLMIILSAVIVLARYRDKKENDEIKKYRRINSSGDCKTKSGENSDP